MNKRLQSLMLGNSFFVFASSLLVPVYALFAEDIGASIELTGLLFAVKFVANTVADLAIVTIRHKMPLAEAIYRSCLFIRGVAWIYLAFYPSITNLFIVQCIMGISEGFGTPAFATLMSDNLDKGRHMKDWAIWELIKNPLIALGGAGSGIIVTEYGFPTLFCVMGVFAIIGSLVPVAKVVKHKHAR